MAAEKRRSFIKTVSGMVKQYFASHSKIVDIDKIEGLDASNVQEALEQLNGIAATGGVTGVKGDNETEYRQGQVNITKENIGLGNVTNDAQVKRSEMGAAGGVAQLDESGKVPASQLPSYVDDVLEYNSKTAFPSAGETGKIYVALDTNITYRWSGSAYVEISQGLALGETASTAYAGDKGKKNAEDIAELKESVTALTSGQTAIVEGNLTVGKASKLANARKITLEGDATGEITFDGSADKKMTLTLSNSGVTAGVYSAVEVDAKGRVVAGNQLIEWGTSGQTSPSDNLAIGGLFFELVE